MESPTSNFFTYEELKSLERMADRISEYIEDYKIIDEHIFAVEEHLHNAVELAELINAYLDNRIDAEEMQYRIELVIEDLDDDTVIFNLN